MEQLKTSALTKVQWNVKFQQILCCMMRFFVFSPHDFETVFSEIYQTELMPSEPGAQVVMSFGTLHSDWQSMKRNDSAVWHHVHTQTSFRRDGEWKGIIDAIRYVADMLGIPIIHRQSDPIEQSYGLRFDGEYLESILRLDCHQARADSPPVDTCFPTPSSLSMDLRPMRESTVESNTASSHHGESLLDGCESTESMDPNYDHSCIWCEWEKAAIGDKDFIRPSTIPSHNENIPSYHTESTQVDFLEGRPDLTFQDGQRSDTLDSQSSIPHEISPPDRPGQCSIEDLPPLLFRWWNKNSQGLNTRDLLVAGAFANIKSLAEGYELEGMGLQDFLLAFKNHVNRVRIQSPFISTFKSPLAPIHRAIRYQDGAIVSVIDPSKLDTKVFKAAPLVELTNTTLRNWKGFGEYEVWEAIPSSAIVCTFDINTLARIAAYNPEIGQFLQLKLIHGARHCTRFLYSKLRRNLENHQGHDMALSRLMELLDVPEPYRKTMCRCFKSSWLSGVSDMIYEMPEDGPRSDSPSNDQDVHPMNMPVYPYPLPCTPAKRTRKAESESSYHPPDDADDSNWESTSEEADNGTQSPEVRCPRRDTPSSGYSVRDRSESLASRSSISLPIKRKCDATMFRSDPPIPITFEERIDVQKTPDVSDTESDEWPAQDESYLF